MNATEELKSLLEETVLSPEYGKVVSDLIDRIEHEYTERTCHIEELDEDGYPVPDSVCGDGFCGACQGIIDIEDPHCKHCGAKLVEQ